MRMKMLPELHHFESKQVHLQCTVHSPNFEQMYWTLSDSCTGALKVIEALVMSTEILSKACR